MRFICTVATAAFLSLAAQAQTAPSSTTPGRSAPVVSDTGPAPPEDRSSTGAIVQDPSPVKAQREAQVEAERAERRAPAQTQGAGARPPEAVRDSLRGSELEESSRPLR